MAIKKNQYKSEEDTSSKKKPVKKPRAKSKKPIGTFQFKGLDRIRQILKDDRFRKSIGASFLLLSIYLLLAFISFLLHWKNDQSLVDGKGFFEFVFITEFDTLLPENWMGKTGAWVSHLFIHKSFGIGAFAFIPISFVLGFKFLFNHSLIQFSKLWKLSFLFLLWTSMIFGYVSSFTGTYLGGAFGYRINMWFTGALGSIGNFFLLALGSFIIIVAWFNPSFSFFSKKSGSLPTSASSDDEHSEFEIPDEHDEYDEYDIEEESISEEELEGIVLKPVQEEEEEEEVPVIEETISTGSVVIDSSVNIEPTVEETQEEEEEEEENPVVEEIPEEIQSPVIESIDLSTDIPEKEEKENVSDELEILVADTTDESIAEISEGFSVKIPPQKEEVLSDRQIEGKLKEFGEYDPKLDLSSYKLPGIDLLNNYGGNGISVNKEELEENKNRIIETLANYKIEIAKIKATIGPTVTLYEIIPAPGVRISKIKNLEDDIALSLAALGIRIIAPIPGKGTIGIEVPNSNPDTVAMRTLLASEKFQNSDMELPIALGKTISNETFIYDLAKMPHLLMAGATGQGKSVGLNAILVSILYKKHPSQVKFVLVDPKKVELTLFNKIERHFLAKLPDEEEPIITDTSKVVSTLNSLCKEMDNRYEMLKNAQVRNIKEYNTKFIKRKLNPENGHRFLPYIVLVVDEFADLIMTAGKEVELPIARLAQLARAIGIHLIIATQRPSVNIITGTIKANFPARIAFRVTSKTDSRTILDAGGADQLIGRGDMLLSTGNDLIRLQCGFVDTPEVEEICNYIGNQRAYPHALLLPEVDSEDTGEVDLDIEDRDEKFEEAARIVVLHQQGSASLLQRKLKLGYNRAGRIVDQLEAAGIIGPFKGSKAREVYVPDEMSLEQFLNKDV